MMILKWAVLLILVFIVPYIVGTLLVTFLDKTYQMPAMNYICGWIICFAVFEVEAVPFVLIKTRFMYLAVTYSLTVVLLMTFSLIKRKRTIGNIFTRLKFSYFRQDYISSAGWLAFGILVLFQIVMMFTKSIYDGDDPYFMVIANMANLDGTMYTKDAYTGFTSSLDMRHAMSPMPLYYTWLAKVSGIHVSTVAHLVFAPAMLMLMYAVYCALSKRLFKKMEKARPWFMVLLAIWYMFGYISLYTVETFALNRTWQGKAILGNVILPMITWCLIMLGDKKAAKGVFVLLTLLGISGVLCTSISFMLIPSVVGLAAIIISITKKDFRLFIKMCLCIIPVMILAMVFLLFK